MTQLWVVVGATAVVVLLLALWFGVRGRRSAATTSGAGAGARAPAGEDPATEAGAPAQDAVDPVGRMRSRLERTRGALVAPLSALLGRADDAAWQRLEDALVSADVGVVAATEIVAGVRERERSLGSRDEQALRALLAEELLTVLAPGNRELRRREVGTTVWLVTGVNGTGKTTTIGKLAAQERARGSSVVLAAADTFRAAAADQLAVWAERAGASLVRRDEGADPASVAFEAFETAEASGADLLIVDTAGRLHNRRELMDELGKVRRVLATRADTIDETLLVLDATTGQNGIAQARAFLEAVEVSGIALTKLDGSSKGGIVVAVQRELGIPVKLVGLGEDVEDLAGFDPQVFVSGLLGEQ